MLKSGRRIVIVPDAKVEHFEPPTEPSADLVDYCRLRNFFAVYILHARASVLPGFLVRYAGLELGRALWRDRRRARLLIRALGAVALRAPVLMLERDRRPLSEYGSL